jgi:hypothetical protein
MVEKGMFVMHEFLVTTTGNHPKQNIPLSHESNRKLPK